MSRGWGRERGEGTVYVTPAPPENRRIQAAENKGGDGASGNALFVN